MSLPSDLAVEHWTPFSMRDGLLLDVALALMVHVFYKSYEPNATQVLQHVLILVVVPAIPATLLTHVRSNVLASLVSFAVFYMSLLTSIVMYRLSPWHPLARYPGPFLAKVTMLPIAYSIYTGLPHLHRKKLHERYGPYVRIGPNEISVNDSSAIGDILGANGMPKGPMWSARKPVGTSLISMRHVHEHAARRKRWNRAFRSQSVKSYEPTLFKRVSQLAYELEKRSEESRKAPIDLHKWLSFFTADFMGDMAFGGGFELMRDGRDTVGVWNLMGAELRAQAYMQSFTWLAPLLVRIPQTQRKAVEFRNFAVGRATDRKTRGSETKDIFYHLIDEGGEEKTPPTLPEVVSDAALAIIAGADTTSSILAGLFFHVLAQSKLYERLRREIDDTFSPGENQFFSASRLAELPFLNAVINETLRMQPAVPTFLQRGPEPGSGGHWLRDTFIPERSGVTISPYILHHDARNFSSPDTFWPERWLIAKSTSQLLVSASTNTNTANVILPEGFVHNTDAFIPFSWGPSNCAGKPLAMLEMRMVVAFLIHMFDMRLADGYDTKSWERDLRDVTVFQTGELPVVLSPRAH